MHAAKEPQFSANAGQFCSNVTITIDWPDKHGTALKSYGGHSESIVVDEHFAVPYLRISISKGLLWPSFLSVLPIQADTQGPWVDFIQGRLDGTPPPQASHTQAASSVKAADHPISYPFQLKELKSCGGCDSERGPWKIRQ